MVQFKRDEYDIEESVVDLDFVDYGDCEEKKITEVFEIRPDFIKLKCQAIQCSLAHVRYQFTNNRRSLGIILCPPPSFVFRYLSNARLALSDFSVSSVLAFGSPVFKKHFFIF